MWAVVAAQGADFFQESGKLSCRTPCDADLWGHCLWVRLHLNTVAGGETVQVCGTSHSFHQGAPEAERPVIRDAKLDGSVQRGSG